MPPIVESPSVLRSSTGSIWANQVALSALKTPLTSLPETTVTGGGFKEVPKTTLQVPGCSVERRAVTATPLTSKHTAPDMPARESKIATSPPSAAATDRVSNYQKRPSPIFNERQPVYAPTGPGGLTRFPKDAFKPGVIFRAALHEEDFMGAAKESEITKTDSNRSETKYGPVYTKQRKMIVVAIHQDHYVAVPLYTHNGKGLSKKGKPDEYVSIRDHRTTGPFTKLSIHAPLVTEYMNSGIRLYDPRSSAHLAYPVSRKYTLPVIPEGCLDKISIKNLLRLYQNYASNADIIPEG